MQLLIWPQLQKKSIKSPDYTGYVNEDRKQVYDLRLWENEKDMQQLDGWIGEGINGINHKTQLKLQRKDPQSASHPIFIGIIIINGDAFDIAFWDRKDKKGNLYYAGKIGKQHGKNDG